MGRLEIDFLNTKFDNPIIPASGCFGFGYEFAEFYDLNILGSISIKGTTLNPRFGNPLPRIAECDRGLINSIGLQNPGVDKVVNHELKELSKVYSKKVIANISGFSIEEYVKTASLITKAENVGWIELNVSCPNVKNGGISFGTDREQISAVIKAVKSVINKPLIVKLSPNVTDIVAIAKACEIAGADALSMINTLYGTRIDLKTKKPVISNVHGGFSGPAIKPIALRCIYQCYKEVNIPIIGIGGVETAEDVIEMMLCGASLVQVGSSNLINPYACKEIIDNLETTMDKYKINSLKDIIGGATKWIKMW